MKPFISIIQCLTFILCLLSQNVFSQGDKAFDKVNFPNQKHELKVALRHLNIADNFRENYHQFDSALLYYYKVDKFNHQNALLQYKIGLTFYLQDELDSADIRLCNSLAIDKDNLKTLFLAGKVAHLQSKWDKALELYTKYNQLYDGVTSPSKTKVTDLISQVNAGKKATINQFHIENIKEINSAANDFQAHLHPNSPQIFFSSDRKSENSVSPDINGDYYTNIYNFNIDSNHVEIIRDHIINPEGNSSVTSISKSGKTMVMYQGALQGVVSYSRFEEINHQKIPKGKTKLPNQINSFFYQQGSGTFTPDGKEFYFSGKRKKEDFSTIYVAKRSGKKWTKASPIFPNDQSNHLNPYFSTNGDTLFYASNSKASMGGYDIFYSIKNGSKWSEKVNLGTVVNSPFDEISYSSNTNGDVLFVASNRPGGVGNYDLYKISKELITAQLEDPVLDEIIATNVKKVALTIIDTETKLPIPGTRLQLYNNEENILLRNTISDQNGDIVLVDLPSNVELGGNILKKGYEFYSRNFTIKNDTSSIVIKLNPIAVDQKVTLQNVFFDHNSSVIKDNSMSELNALLNFLLINDKVNILIEGHTDNVGDEDYNINLSNTRANAILRYLNQSGIPEYRLQSKGYGSSLPVADNTSEKGKALNRRTEFKIIKTN
ncbi:OmpA family protein [Flammeovirga pacifica]|uniref:OmpA-like domain-containing protein n=1 Tax=Flammeovirga pacifica TaxID=915059 RepID=A0A1S1YVQ5_FLAPC|nr:OmpA family protein [Flammeovirga pacifica]OHX65070.1 hypothetical protein NH26_01240 [Flammeovirga pacifica]